MIFLLKITDGWKGGIIDGKEVTIYLSKYETTPPTIQRTQLPLKLSGSYTVHKVLGLILNAAIIRFDLKTVKPSISDRCMCF